MEKPLLVVMGAGPGVSYHVAELFGKQGFKVALVARNAERLEKLSESLTEKGIKSSFYTCDVSEKTAIDSCFEKIKQDHGPAVDALMYNAAVMRKETPSEQDYESLVKDFKVDIAGAVYSCQKVLNHMKSKKQGTVLLTGGGLALKPYYEYTSLSIGKAGIRSLAFCLAQELKGTGIKVGTVTIAGMVKENTHFSPEKIAQEFWKLHTGENKGVEFIYQ